MIARVSPQRRGVISDEDRAAITAAKAARDEADEAYREAVAQALRNGASVREVERFTGLAMQTISDWGHARGWPTSEQKGRREQLGGYWLPKAPGDEG